MVSGATVLIVKINLRPQDMIMTLFRMLSMKLLKNKKLQKLKLIMQDLLIKILLEFIQQQQSLIFALVRGQIETLF